MRDKDSKKGDFGRVLTVSGSEIYTGAPFFSAQAALFAGCDVSSVAAPEKTAWTIASYSPDLICYKLKGVTLKKEHIKQIKKIDFDCLVIGPGLGTDKKAIKAAELLAKSAKKVVLDADFLKSKKVKIPKGAIITPNRNEFQILFGRLDKNKRTAYQVRDAAKKFGITILLKGPIDYVSDGTSIFENTTGNAYMTTGGTGDILTGICASFFSRSKSTFECAKNAAFVNGICGDVCLQNHKVVLPSLMLQYIPKVMSEAKLI